MLRLRGNCLNSAAECFDMVSGLLHGCTSHGFRTSPQTQYWTRELHSIGLEFKLKTRLGKLKRDPRFTNGCLPTVQPTYCSLREDGDVQNPLFAKYFKSAAINNASEADTYVSSKYGQQSKIESEVKKSNSNSLILKILEGLSTEQKAAVVAPIGPIRVVAGPGSGKTRVLTNRVAYMVTGYSIDPKKILCITFTNRAAREMKERLQNILGASATESLRAGTFHSKAAQMLRGFISHLESAQRTSSFVVYDDDDRTKLVSKVVKEVARVPKFRDERAILNYLADKKLDRMERMIAGKRGMEYRPQKDLNKQKMQIEVLKNLGVGQLDRVIHEYERRMQVCDAVDFDDLIYLTVECLYEVPGVLKFVQRAIQHVLVDEFQDTDAVQYELVRLLSLTTQSLFVVGDIDQAIYSWRGANPKNMKQQFDKDFPLQTTLKLSTNYRSSRSIIEAASQVIADSEVDRGFGSAGPLTLVPAKAGGEPVVVRKLDTCHDEAWYVVDNIASLIRTFGYQFKDFAVLYRTNAQTRMFEEKCIQARIPYVIRGGNAFFTRKEVKDAIAYLRLTSNPNDEIALDRVINVPPRGIGETSWTNVLRYSFTVDTPITSLLQDWVQDMPSHSELGITSKSRAAIQAFCMLMHELRLESERLSPAKLLDAILHRAQYWDYLESSVLKKKEGEPVEEKNKQLYEGCLQRMGVLRSFAANSKKAGPAALRSFLEEVLLASGGLDETSERNAVSLLTLHSAKGLEFPCVFVTGLEEGLLPMKTEELEGIAEERRLCYVGMTRAKDRLFLLCCEERSHWGTRKAAEVSRFIKRKPSLLPNRSGTRMGRGSAVPPPN